SINEYLYSLSYKPDLLTQDVREELQQYKIFLQDAIPDINDMYKLRDLYDIPRIENVREIVLKKIDLLSGEK
ncbi:MAG: hypothetical protein FWF53_01965, partial [Candidatus Azobacteroides sp.]|nr:hypothetical protein [Candidatus Azobacteroides sp.]